MSKVTMKPLIFILAMTVYFLNSLVSEPKITMRLIESTSDLNMPLFLAVRDALAEESRLTHPIDFTKGVK